MLRTYSHICMSPNVHLDEELYQELGRYGNRDESWNDVVSRVLENLDEESALEDRNDRTTTHSRESTSSVNRPLENLLEDGTTLRHKYRRGDYSGEVVEATVEDGRINVEGDDGPKPDVDTRSPSGAAREADKILRGDDARGRGYNGWDWWEYREKDKWKEIRTLTEDS